MIFETTMIDKEYMEINVVLGSKILNNVQYRCTELYQAYQHMVH